MSDLISSDLEAELKNSWKTDPEVFNVLNKEFNFDLDAAASSDNALCKRYITKEMDALNTEWSKHAWHSKTVFVNPPYGRGYIQKFMEKAVCESFNGLTTVLLVPATLDAQWLPIHNISEIRIITGGRLSFYHPIKNTKVNGNTKGSMIVIFRPTKMPCFVRLIDRDEFLDKKIKATP